MWDAFKDFIYWGMSVCYSWVGDWGMAILITTVLFRLCLFPLMQRQIKSSYAMSKMSPLMQEVQEKYKDDPERLQQETQRIYKESKFNPIAGCLPLFLQMPIFIALFQVLSEMSWRTEGNSYNFYHLVPDLTMTPASALDVGVMTFIPYIILLLAFAGLTFLPMVLMQKGQTGQQHNQTLIMSAVMTGMMLFVGWSSPGGVLLFWGISSLFGLVQQQVVTRTMKHEDEEKEEELIEVAPVKVTVERKVKKKRPTKNR